jgi:hypothetical protein
MSVDAIASVFPEVRSLSTKNQALNSSNTKTANPGKEGKRASKVN